LVAHGKQAYFDGLVHGFTTSFKVSAGVFAVAAIIVFFMINATKDSLKANDDAPAVHVG
jgi:hypothetical protein